jgi:hypothetical protein
MHFLQRKGAGVAVVQKKTGADSCQTKRCPARGERISAGQRERTGTHHQTREEP